MSDPLPDELRQLETRLQRAAEGFAYPPTPQLGRQVRARLAQGRSGLRPTYRLAYAGLIAIALTIALFTVPPVRAIVLEFIRLGAVRILPPAPTEESSAPIGPVTATPASAVPTEPSPLLDLSGQTTLADARERAGFSILLPAYPPDLGEPDSVFLQQIGGTVVVLVWLDADNPAEVALSLHELGPEVDALKGPVTQLQQTRVNGAMALWTEGEYMLMYLEGGRENADFRHLVEGHVLIWMIDEVTYRLETSLSLEEAVRIAESLR